MVCRVPGCNNDYKRKPDLPYFSLPKDEQLQKIWLRFCKLDRKDLTPNFVICGDHFSRDVIEGSMQVEMGLATKRRLTPGAIPTIRFPKKCVRDRKMDKRTSKKIVDTLLEEYAAQIRQTECATLAKATEFVEVGMESEEESESDSESETETSSDEDLDCNESEIITDVHISLIDQEDASEPVKKETSFKKQIELLEKENKFLKQENSILSERLLSVERRYQYEINELKEKLEKAEVEKNVVEERENEMEPMWTVIPTE